MNYSVLNNWPNKSNTVNTGKEAEPFIPKQIRDVAFLGGKNVQG